MNNFLRKIVLGSALFLMQEVSLSSILKIEAQVPPPPRLNDYMSRCYGLGNPGATAQCRRHALQLFSRDAKAWSQRYETPGRSSDSNNSCRGSQAWFDGFNAGYEGRQPTRNYSNYEAVCFQMGVSEGSRNRYLIGN